MAPRAGFIIQNATTAGANLDLAEPDAQDFNLLGNTRHGVITGCAVSVSGSGYAVSVAPGVGVVDGALVLTGGSITLATSGSLPRFDLIRVDAGGAVGAIQGTASANPVFPDFDDTVTILASVMLRPGVFPQSGDVTDKRLMLTQRFVTAVAAGSVVHNVDPTTLAQNFDIASDGTVTWDGDGTTLGRYATKSLRVHDNLDVVGTLSTGALSTTGDLNVTGDLIGSNFRQGAGPPSGTATQGDIYKNLTDGSIWAYQGAIWVQLSTVPIPAGMTMWGFMTTAPSGWLLVNGQTVSRAVSGGLWNAFPSWQNVANQTVTLPNATNCYMGWGTPGTKFGNVSNQVTLQTTNLPAHKHLTTPTALADGSHAHTVSQTPAGNHNHVTLSLQGAHAHGVNDPGHAHPAAPGGGGPTSILTRVFSAPAGYQQGNQPIVLADTTGVATTGFNSDGSGSGPGVNTAGSNHTHTTNAVSDHTHGFAIDPGGSTHTHAISESLVGNGTPFDIRPPTIGAYLYIKT